MTNPEDFKISETFPRSESPVLKLDAPVAACEKLAADDGCYYFRVQWQAGGPWLPLRLVRLRPLATDSCL